MARTPDEVVSSEFTHAAMLDFVTEMQANGWTDGLSGRVINVDFPGFAYSSYLEAAMSCITWALSQSDYGPVESVQAKSKSELLMDIVDWQPQHERLYSVQDLEREFAEELKQFDDGEIDEVILREIICEAVDRHNF